MTAAPLVSVLMPVYQAERWLPEALESAFEQTFTDFELVAVDDGSTDGSVRILEDWARREPRLRVVRAAHGGLAHAREISLREARGRFAAFLDADDRWLPRRLERQLPHVDDDTVVFAATYIGDLDGPVWGRPAQIASGAPTAWPATGLFSVLLEANFIPVLTVLAPIRQLVEAGSFRRAERMGFETKTAISCDYEMWLALSLRGMRFHFVDEPLGVYRIHSNQLTSDALEIAVEELRVFNSFRGEAAGSDRRNLRRRIRGARQQLERAHRKEAWRRLSDGDRRSARRHLVASLRARPTAPRAWLALFLFQIRPLARRVAVPRSAES